MKRIGSVIAVFVVMILGYFGWKHYQDSTKKIIALDEVVQSELKEDGSDLVLTGKLQLDKFETFILSGAEQKENDLYIYLVKQKSLFNFDGSNEINETIGLISDKHESPEHIYLVEGEDIVVKYATDNKADYIDTQKYTDKKEL